jgi:DNA-binding NarL/FixJ family response regulator
MPRTAKKRESPTIHPVPVQEEQEMQRMREEGYTVKEIALTFNRSVKTVLAHVDA